MGVLVKNGKSYTGTGDLLIQPVIYSDDERCIGVWRDGKPLYQKTISFDDTMFQNDGSGKKITVTIPDVESVKTSQVFIENNVLPLTYSQDSIYATYWAIVNDTNTVDIVFRYSSDVGSNLHGFFIGSTAILQYTKTTDTAGTAAWVPTGATPIHYSLNEQVIGTWIDGKPIYKITIPVTHNYTLPNSGWLHITELDTIAQDIGVIIDVKAISYEGVYNNIANYTTRIVETSFNESLPRTISFQSMRNGNDYLNSGGFIILQYTKHTD